MKKYIGTKQIEAEPMTMGEAFIEGFLQRDKIPSDEEKSKKGYHVKYKDGYESWSPVEAFDGTYRCCDTFVDRLHIELDELKDKSEKLNKFFDTEIFKNLPKNKQTLMTAQFGSMISYAAILEERIRIEEQESKSGN